MAIEYEAVENHKATLENPHHNSNKEAFFKTKDFEQVFFVPCTKYTKCGSLLKTTIKNPKKKKILNTSFLTPRGGEKRKKRSNGHSCYHLTCCIDYSIKYF
uniref:Uncharacterized protein n=1 Tax=Rhizophora mucronata TaxID=61149 RepID=A0A2P2M4G3_RHIMU